MDSNSVPLNNQVFFDALDVCCQKIVEKMGDKTIGDWRVADYNSLSSQLGKHTKVYLSVNTLKRIFGRLKTTERYYPQKATRDALAQFIGYRDWQEFEVFLSSRKNEEKTESIFKDESILPDPSNRKRNIKPYFFWGSIGLVLLIIIYSLIAGYGNNQVPNVKLVCENPFGSVPHTAVFKLTSKTFFDKNEEFQLDCMEEALPAKITGNKRITRFFKNPGVVYVTLLHRNKPLDTASVCLQTKGWVANSGNDTSRAYPIARLKPLDPKNITVTASQLDSAGLDTKKPFLVGFSNIHPSNISGDNFSFSTRVFAEQSRPGAQCIETTIIILGEKDRHVLTLFRENCVALSRYAFSEQKVTGADQFLGALAFNPENGGIIQITVKNKSVSVVLNSKNAFNTNYSKSIGRVLGIKILFSGIGKAISPELKDLLTGETF